MIALALVSALLAAPPVPAQDTKAPASAAAAISLGEYRARLAGIDAALSRGEREQAAAQAKSLLGEEIATADGPLSPDRAALAPIADASGPAHRARIELLLRQLGEASEQSRGADRESRKAAPDKAALESIRLAQADEQLERGGVAEPLSLPTKTLLDALLSALYDSASWVVRQLKRLSRWLFRNLSGSANESEGWGNTNLFIFIATGFVVALVILLAVRARLARDLRLLQALGPQRPPAAEDEDPLSRSTHEWEARARDLAAAGRAREAIRAWYHAVLVACYASGLLHHRRGRTNWEYAAALSPATAWRPRFFALTRWFDEQWYGRAESSDESLALFSEDAVLILRALRERAR